MTVNTEYRDRCGRYPLVFKGYKHLAEVHEYLFEHYQGFHFCIMLDETKDEYEPFPKELYVYFSDEALEEIAVFAGKKVVER